MSLTGVVVKEQIFYSRVNKALPVTHFCVTGSLWRRYARNNIRSSLYINSHVLINASVDIGAILKLNANNINRHRRGAISKRRAAWL